MYDRDAERETHPSYGMFQISRVTSRGRNLFGCSVTHHNTIMIRVHRGDVERNLATDWFHAGEELIEVEMSPAQFAEAITSLNCGSGVPCTIRHLNREDVEEPSYRHVREMFRGEFRKKAKDAADVLGQAIELARSLYEDKAPTKAKREELLKALGKAHQEIASNMPFLTKMYDEHMENSETEAKAAVEAFMLHAVTSAGLQALRAPTPDTPIVSLEPPEPVEGGRS